MRGQAALEYMFLIGLMFIMLAGVFLYSTQTSLLSLRTIQSTEAVQAVADAADRVYEVGGGNTTVTVNIPSGVVNQNVSNKLIKLSLNIGNQTGDAFASTIGNVTGSLPKTQGRYRIVVEMLPTGVIQVRPL